MSSARFHGKVAFVTGAAGGIGRETALVYAQQGAHVVVTDLPGEALDTTRQLIADAGTRLARRRSGSPARPVRCISSATVLCPTTTP